DALSPVVAAWTAAGNDAPLLFDWDQLRNSSDAFPIELADIRQSRKVLAGEDPFVDVTIDNRNLRLQLDRELKGKLLALRSRYLATQGRGERIERLMTGSLSTFLVLFRAALRLFEPQVPPAKLAALDALTRHISFDPEPFRCVYHLRAGHALPAG